MASPRRLLAHPRAATVAVIALLSVTALSCQAQSHSSTAVARGSTRGGALYDSVILRSHPVAFWDLAVPGRREPDLTRQGHVGVYRGGMPTLATMPNGNHAADFNGSSQYLRVRSSPTLSISTTGQLTWEAWIRPDELQWSPRSDPHGYGYVDWMGKCNSYAPTCEWEARMYSRTNAQGRCSRLSAYVFNPSAGYGSAADWQPRCGVVQPGRWLYVVGEYQTRSTPAGCSAAHPGTIDIWVNGVRWNPAYHRPTGCMSQYGITPQAHSSPLDIGTMALDTWFNGAVGKVALYGYLLSQSQIDAHFTAMTGRRSTGRCADMCTLSASTP